MAHCGGSRQCSMMPAMGGEADGRRTQRAPPSLTFPSMECCAYYAHYDAVALRCEAEQVYLEIGQGRAWRLCPSASAHVHADFRSLCALPDDNGLTTS
jgi:hypothetical protein